MALELLRLLPEKRRFTTTETTEAAIEPGLMRDLYVALGNPLDNGSWSVRIEYKPLVRFIWLGGILMMLGGILAASDRRYRQDRRVAAGEGRPMATESEG